MSLSVVALTVLLVGATVVSAQDTTVRQQLAPTGTLRVGLNGGNALTRAVGPEIARELARRLGVEAVFTTYPTPGAVTDGVRAWDIAFIAADPDRMAEIAFTPPYVLLDATYIVRDDSPIRAVADIDRPGTTVASGATSAYTLYMRRELKQARIVSPSNAEALDGVRSGTIAGFAGLRFDLIQTAAQTPGLRVLPDNITRAQQAVALPKGNQAALAYVVGFLQEMKQSGFIAGAITRTGLSGAVPAE